MFRKPFHTKSATKIKNSEKTKLLRDLHNSGIIDTNSVEPWDQKADITAHKVQMTGGNMLTIYYHDKLPMLFEAKHESRLMPSVYFMWATKSSMPTIVVPENVMQFVDKGADIMLPGVIVSETFPTSIAKGQLCALCLLSFSDGKQCLTGPVALLESLMSNDEMFSCGMKGKGFVVLHSLHDSLWEAGPQLPPPQISKSPSLNIEQLTISDKDNTKSEDNDTVQSSESESENTEVATTSENPDDLLYRCFLAALKYRLPRDQFPFDVGTFCVNCLFKCVPTGRRLDIKHTSYKKFGVFLKQRIMLIEPPLLRIVEQSAGVDAIQSCDFKHKLLTTFVVTDERIEDDVECDENFQYTPPEIRDVYILTAPSMPLFREFDKNLTKHDAIARVQLRPAIEFYVRKHNLQRENGDVEMDDVLREFLQIRDFVTDYKTMMSHAVKRLTPAVQMYFPRSDRTTIIKCEKPCIVMTVEVRMGRKKVTLIDNLPTFGIDVSQFSTLLATEAASSCVVRDDNGGILVQGNNITAASNLLLNKYKIERKYITGLELAPKKKKAK